FHSRFIRYYFLTWGNSQLLQLSKRALVCWIKAADRINFITKPLNPISLTCRQRIKIDNTAPHAKLSLSFYAIRSRISQGSHAAQERLYRKVVFYTDRELSISKGAANRQITLNPRIRGYNDPSEALRQLSQSFYSLGQRFRAGNSRFSCEQ